MTTAFIGLGNMGLPMAQNLHAAGVEVVAFDVVPDAVAAATAAGLSVADSPEAAVAGAETVITMLPNGAIVRDVYSRILPAAPQGSLFIDCSTVAIADANEAAEAARAAGHRAADAPVSGGVGGAQAGSLTFMLGCAEDDLEQISALLDPMAGRVIRCGEVGSGQAAKICNNMLLGITMRGVCEAFVLGEALGLDHQALFDVASTSSGSCWSLNTYCPVPGPVPTSPANNDYQPGFAAALMAKDLNLAQSAANDHGLALDLGAAVTALYTAFAQEAGEGLDFSAMVHEVRAASQRTAPEITHAHPNGAQA